MCVAATPEVEVKSKGLVGSILEIGFCSWSGTRPFSPLVEGQRVMFWTQETRESGGDGISRKRLDDRKTEEVSSYTENSEIPNLFLIHLPGA